MFWRRFFTAAKDAYIDVACSGIEANSSLQIEERYHIPLQNSFLIAKLFMVLHIRGQAILAVCIKSLSDILGSKELVSSALLPGIYLSTQVFEKLRGQSLPCKRELK